MRCVQVLPLVAFTAENSSTWELIVNTTDLLRKYLFVALTRLFPPRLPMLLNFLVSDRT